MLGQKKGVSTVHLAALGARGHHSIRILENAPTDIRRMHKFYRSITSEAECINRLITN
jgi:hypothetical protein